MTEREQVEIDGWNLVCAGPSMANLRPEHILPGCPVVTVNRAIQIMDQGIKVHFAAFADGPVGCWKICDLERYIYQDPTIQLWVTLRNVTKKEEIRRKRRWKTQVPAPHFLEACVKIFPEPIHKSLVQLAEKYLMDPDERFFVDVPGPHLIQLWDKELPACVGMRIIPHGSLPDAKDQKIGRLAFTSFCALDRIWMFSPKRLRILCCDMAGSWIADKTEAECAEIEQQKVADGKSPGALDRWAHERHHMLRSVAIGKERYGTEVDWIIPEPEAVKA